MKPMFGSVSAQIFAIIFLLFAMNLLTGCISNKSIRGGNVTLSAEGKPENHNGLLVRLEEKDAPTRNRETQEKDEEELSFRFKKPVSTDIGNSCDENKDCSHEKITYESNLCVQPGSCSADLFVLEFDDQGRLYHPHQMEHLFTFLKDTMSPKNECKPSDEKPCFDDVSLVVAAHGWRHNTDFEDWNLRQLREVLYNAVLSEADIPGATTTHLNPSQHSRKVVGVYLGWRGATVNEQLLPKVVSKSLLTVPALLTFWDRKGAALDVALGSTRELFARLGHIRAEVNDKTKRLGRHSKWYEQCASHAGATNTCLAMRSLILGHSFGSLAIYNAISESLIKSVAAGVDSQKNNPTVEELSAMEAAEPNTLVSSPYADLIVLINPAFEGARFEPLYQASLNRMKSNPYPTTQDPVLVLVTGTSDFATRFAFPFGRWFSTLFQDNSPESRDGNPIGTSADEEVSANRNTVGHIPRYMTHYLDIFHDTATPLPIEATDSNEICLKTDWYKLTSDEIAEALKKKANKKETKVSSLETTIDRIATLWRTKLDENGTNNQNWPARAYCGGMRLSPAMHEPHEGKDPLYHLPSTSPDQEPWRNQLVSKDISNDQWGSGLRDAHNPIWVVRTHDKRIIDGHNGYQNSNMVGFIMQLYRDAITRK